MNTFLLLIHSEFTYRKMNTRYIFIIASILIASISSCLQQEPSIPTPKLSFSEKVDSDFESITLSCLVSGNVSVNRLSIEYSKDQSFAGTQRLSLQKKGDSFYVTISGLEIQTTYYYRYIVENKASSYAEETIRQLKTLDYVAPIVSTGEVKNVSGTKASLEGTVDYSCGKDVTAQGFKFGKDKDQLEEIPIEAEAFSLELEGLEFETVYYYQAYATSEIGTGYGEIREFKTCNAVSFKDITIKDITASGALVSGGIEDNGGIEIENQGFRFNADLITDYTFVSSTGETTLEGLKPATTYQVWYYAKTFEGEFESEKVEFTTSDGVITFGTTAASNITAESIYITSSISNDGGSAIRERGLVYGTNNLPTIEGTLAKIVGTIGQLDGVLTSLTNSTTYYIRPYAINDVGVSYGPQVTVSTLSGIAELSKTTVSQVLAQSAVLSSSVLSDNGAEIEIRGFCFSETETPTINESKIVVGGTIGLMTGSLSSLKEDTRYYVRAFATTKYGTVYGKQVSFTTLNGVILFDNLILSETTATSISISASITSDGGSPIIKRGFCYALKSSPSISDEYVLISGTTGNMINTLNNLKNNSKYYLRAFATNSVGTFYSNELTECTLTGLASVGSTSVTNIKAQSATLMATIESLNGSRIIARGFCYGTDDKPSIENSIIDVSGDIGSMTATISNLANQTTYYVRAFATTPFGTSYGEQFVFTTLDGVVSFGSLSVGGVTASSLTIYSSITTDGGSEIIEKGFCYTTDNNEPLSTWEYNSVVGYDDEFQMLYSSTISPLQRNTMYYLRAYAKTEMGIYYSTTVFPVTTLSGIATLSIDEIVYITTTKRVVVTLKCEKNGSEVSDMIVYYGSSSSSLTKIADRSGTSAVFFIPAPSLNHFYVKGVVRTNYGTVQTNVIDFWTDKIEQL